MAATINGGTTAITVQSDTAVNTAAGNQLIEHLRANRAECQGLTILVGHIPVSRRVMTERTQAGVTLHWQSSDEEDL